MNRIVSTLVLMGLAVFFVPQQAQGDQIDDLVRGIVDAKIRRIAVLPNVIHRGTNAESSVGKLGPRALTMPDALYEELSQRSKGGELFQVVNDRTVRGRIRARSFGIENLSDLDSLREFGRAAGADGLVTMTYFEQGEATEFTSTGSFSLDIDAGNDKVRLEVIDLKDGFSAQTASFVDAKTLSKAAYQGQSFELRRWQDSELLNLGFELDDNQAFGKGLKWERLQFENLTSELLHPFDISDCPLGMEIIVDEQKRNPYAFESKNGPSYVVELNSGEEFAIRLRNETGREVYCALYVDGVSTIDKKLAEPGDLYTFDHWRLPGDRTWNKVRGWYMMNRQTNGQPSGNQQDLATFKIASSDSSVAFGEGLEEKIGTITAIFYTVGMDDINQPNDSSRIVSRGLPRSDFGVGIGKRKNVNLDFKAGDPPGLLLSAITVHYRSKEQLSDFRNDPVLNDDDETSWGNLPTPLDDDNQEKDDRENSERKTDDNDETHFSRGGR